MKSALLAKIKSHFNKQTTDKFAGISIHPECIRIVKIKQLETGYECLKSEEYPIGSQDKLGKLLSQIIHDFHLQNIRSVLVINNNKTESAQIDLSELPVADIFASLPWQVKDLISIPPQDMICDYIEMNIQPLGQQPKAQVMATSRAYLETLITPFHQNKAEILGITTEQFVVARMQSTQDTAQLVFIQHKASDAILLILKNQQICFARKIRGADTIINMPQQDILDGGSDFIAIEIQRSIDYYESQLKQPPIKNVLVAIAGDNESIVIDALNNSLPIKTIQFPIMQINNASPLEYLAALGAANYAIQEGAQ
jgi:MSHA biogenesis protein MshI